MKRLLSVDIENFCQHSHLHADFGQMTAIIGPNGSGKTNLLSSIGWCLTGDMPLPGALVTFINQLATKGAKSGVKLTLAPTEGTVAELTRNLSPSSRSLKYGSETLRRDADIIRKIEEWFGLPMKVLNTFSFISQKQLTAFIDQEPAERIKSFHRLFRLDRAEACWNAVNKRLSNLNIPAPAFDEEATRSNIANYHKTLDELLATRHCLGEPNLEFEAQARKLIADQEHADRAEVEIGILYREHGQLSEDLRSLSKEAAETTDLLQKLKVVKYEDIVVKAARSRDAWKAIKCIDTKVDNLKTRQKLLVQEINNKPIPPVAPDWLAEDDKRLQVLKSDADSTETFFKYFRDTGVTACPTCRRAIDADPEEVQERYEKLLAQIATEEARRDSNHAYSHNLDAYIHWIDERNVRLEVIVNQITDLVNERPTELDESEEEIGHYLQEADSAIVEIGNLERDLTAINTHLIKSHARIEEIERRLEELKKDWGKGVGNGDTLENLKAQLKQYDTNARERVAVEAKIDVIKRSLADAENILVQLAEIKKSSVKVLEWKGSLEKVRATLHRDALPKRIAQSYLEQMEDDVNKSMDFLGLDFRIKVADDLSFVCYFTDGRVMPAVRLSLGEQVMFALAWRITVNATFATDVGILCLDEPSTHLDVERLKCLRRALERLREISGEIGLQCIITTHHTTLLSAFDHVIELKAPSV